MQANRSLPTGTVTFVMTDVEGSTSLWEQHADLAGAVIELHDTVVAAAVDAAGGFLLKSKGEGDSTFSVFDDAAAALAAGVAMHRGLARQSWPGDLAPRIRTAVYTGEAELRDGDYHGVAPNRGGRLRSTAHGGQLICSQATEEQARHRLPEAISLRDLGLHRLRDIAAAERVFQVLHQDLPDEFPPLRSLGVRQKLPSPRTTLRGSRGRCPRGVQAPRDRASRHPHGGRRLRQDAPRDRRGVRTAGALRGWRVLRRPGSARRRVGGTGRGGRRGGAHADGARDRLRCPGPRAARLPRLALGRCWSSTTASTSSTLRPSWSTTSWSAAPVSACWPRAARPSTSTASRPWPSRHSPSTSDDALAGPSPAARLFCDRAALASADLVLSADDERDVEELCRHLDGIPLAIELAAAQAAHLSPREILERLDDRFPLLAAGRRRHPRQRTLHATLDWSHDLLSDGERSVLRRLAVFPGALLPRLGRGGLRVARTRRLAPLAGAQVAPRDGARRR